MNNPIALNSSRFVLLMLIQILILNNINFTIWGINPFLYILFLLLLPSNIPNWLLLILAFFTGFILDIFTDSNGLHSFSAVLCAYFRPIIIQRLSIRDVAESNTSLDMQTRGMAWFLKYAFFMVLIHHVAYYFMEAFTLSNFFRTIFIIILSSIFTVLVIVVSEFITFKRSR